MTVSRREFIKRVLATAGVASAVVLAPSGLLAASKKVPEPDWQQLRLDLVQKAAGQVEMFADGGLLTPEQAQRFCDTALRPMKLIELDGGGDVCSSCVPEGKSCMTLPMPARYIDIKVSIKKA
jgi:hypothetical protein